MTYKCPYCEKDFGAAELQIPAGATGGAYCPHCRERVRVFYPYGGLVAIVSLLVAIGTFVLLHVRPTVMFAIGIVLIWVPLSLYLKLVSVRYGPPTLKRWKERRKTFFEWLGEALKLSGRR